MNLVNLLNGNIKTVTAQAIKAQPKKQVTKKEEKKDVYVAPKEPRLELRSRSTRFPTLPLNDMGKEDWKPARSSGNKAIQEKLKRY